MVSRTGTTGAVVPTAAGLAVSAAAAAPGATPAPQVTAGDQAPGEDPAVQEWFQRQQGDEIEFQNALLQAEHGIAAPSASTTASCRRLDRAARALQGALPAPNAALNGPVGGWLTDILSATGACMRGDVKGAAVSITQGVVKRAAAQDTIDEVLDGGK